MEEKGKKDADWTKAQFLTSHWFSKFQNEATLAGQWRKYISSQLCRIGGKGGNEEDARVREERAWEA